MLNGRPVVGRPTVGPLLAERIGARLLDAHSLYNLASALTDKGTPAFEETVGELRAIARRRILAMPSGVPVILTDAKFADSAWGNAIWDETRDLARARGGPFLVAVLDCAPQENARRLRSPERMGKRKPMDGTILRADRYAGALLRRDADAVLDLDVTAMAPDAAAARIADWAREAG